MIVSEASGQVLAELLEAHTGQELLPNRRWRLGSALSAIMRDQGCTSLDQLIARLSRKPDDPLVRQVIEALLNNETYFFRDKMLFDLLSLRILPELIRKRAGTRKLTIWSAGCSTGQEPLSLAMLLAELEHRLAGWRIDILATDVSASVVDAARRAVFSQFQVQRGLGVMQMLRWFDEVPEGWRAKPDLLRRIRFQQHNLLEPLPRAGEFDLILCRNVLLYFDAATRNAALDRLSGAMASDGLLMLGAGETVRGRSQQFRAADGDLAGLFCLDQAEGWRSAKPAKQHQPLRPPLAS